MIQLLTWGYRIFVPGVIALSIIITVIHELSTLGCLTLKVTNIRRTRRLVRCSSSLCTFLQSLSLVVHTWLHPYIGYQSISKKLSYLDLSHSVYIINESLIPSHRVVKSVSYENGVKVAIVHIQQI